MLSNLPIQKRMNVCTLKANLACVERQNAIEAMPVAIFRSSLRDLLREEPAFLLLDQAMFDDVLSFCQASFDEKNYVRLLKLAKESLSEKQKQIIKYLECDYFKRGVCYDLSQYPEMLEIDDNLLQQNMDFDFLLDSQFVLNSIRYVKLAFADYYEKNHWANQYLYQIYKAVEAEDVLSFEAFYSMETLFHGGNQPKVYTFSKKI